MFAFGMVFPDGRDSWIFGGCSVCGIIGVMLGACGGGCGMGAGVEGGGDAE
jgi:hypothetical protein